MSDPAVIPTFASNHKHGCRPITPRLKQTLALWDSLPDGALVDARTVVAVTGQGQSTLYRRMQHGLFPRPVKVGFNSRWTKKTILDWMAQCGAEVQS